MSMTSSSPATWLRWQRQPHSTNHGLVPGVGRLAIVLAVSWEGADMRPMELLRDSGNMATYASEFFPPNFASWQMYVQEMLATLQIAVWGTALAVLTAIPFGCSPLQILFPGGYTSQCAGSLMPFGNQEWCLPCCLWWR